MRVCVCVRVYVYVCEHHTVLAVATSGATGEDDNEDDRNNSHSRCGVLGWVVDLSDRPEFKSSC